MNIYDNNLELNSGISAFESRDFTKAMRLLSPLAEQGNVEALYRMAIMYQHGLGFVKNPQYAYKWMLEAAEKDFALAQHGMGVMYLHGECVEKDEKKALEWFHRAAVQNLPGAQMALGTMYENGQGVEKNETEAKRWYALVDKEEGG